MCPCVANRYTKTLVLVGVVLGYMMASGVQARGVVDLSQDEIANYERNMQQAQQQLLADAVQQQQQQQPSAGGLDRLDSDDDDDDDDRVQLQPMAGPNTHSVQSASSDLYQTGQTTSYQPPLSVGDLRVAASKHHGHKHGAKGWLDMGAWTGKKGAFGWYDKHPVGKGK